jgi:hypothetical protein
MHPFRDIRTLFALLALSSLPLPGPPTRALAHQPGSLLRAVNLEGKLASNGRGIWGKLRVDRTCRPRHGAALSLRSWLLLPSIRFLLALEKFSVPCASSLSLSLSLLGGLQRKYFW